MSVAAPARSYQTRRWSLQSALQHRRKYPGSASKRAHTPPVAHLETDTYEGHEWNVVEDVHMLHVIKEEQCMSYTLMSTSLGHVPNWRHVSIELSLLMNHYRSPRQCSIRFEGVVVKSS